VVAPGGGVRYVATGKSGQTTVEAIRTRNGKVFRATRFAGRFGVPAVTFDGALGGLSADGSTLVLGDLTAPSGGYPLKRRSSFAVVDARGLRLRERVALRGDFSFDALSPDGSRLYLIQHVSQTNLQRYVVRAYDLAGRRLLPGRIADRTQRGWVMNGSPVTRATSADGRWVYTLYLNPGGYPFVHALDTVRGVAHCVGIPWRGKQNTLWKLRLSLSAGGNTLFLHWPSGREYLAVTKGTWRITHPAPAARAAGGGGASSSGFPWWTLGVAGAAVLLLGGGALLLRRRASPLGPLAQPRA
jgi:hypothetical protein